MKEITRKIILVILFQGIVFSLGWLDFGSQSVFHIHPLVYLLLEIAIISTIAIPVLQYASLYMSLLMWALIYIVTLFIRIKILNLVLFYQVVAIEFLLLEAAVWLSHALAGTLNEQEKLMRSFVYSVFPGRILNLQDAEDRISLELLRSRRHNRPLTIIVIKSESGVIDRPDHEVLELFAETRIGQIINGQARQTDLIMRDRSGQFIILCPETDFTNSTILAERIQQAISEKMGVSVSWGVASFPEEGLTIDGLLYKARLRSLRQAEQTVHIKKH
jgi:GGDEF domain-containing protein